MVYVDELRTYQATLPGARRHFGGGKKSCHMTADTPEELHEFAARMKLKREWAQKEGTPILHYDLTPGMRVLAVLLGAREVTARDDARRIAALIFRERSAHQ